MLRKKSFRIHSRRKSADLSVRLMRLFGICGWLMMFAALVVLTKAQPERSLIDENFLAQFGHYVSLRRVWDLDLTRYIYYLMIMGLCLGALGLPLHLRRNRREDDGYGLYLVLLIVISLAGIIMYQLTLAR